MRIITVNLPESYLKTIEYLVGNSKCFPSRSELVRVAVREFILKELEYSKGFAPPEILEEIKKENIQIVKNPTIELDNKLIINGKTYYKVEKRIES